MKEWWDNLVLREKQILSMGLLVLVFVAFYLILWSPLTDKVSTLRNQVQRNQELLAWMQDTDKRIQAEGHAAKPPVARASGSLLSIVQSQINRTQLVSVMTQLHQIDNDSVQLTFDKVDFDKLIVWLTQLTQQQGLIITQMTVTPSKEPGIVAADFILKL
jgi:general secretion pathway protein M